VIEISYQDPIRYFAPFAKQEGAVLLHSAMQHPVFGRYSIIATNPYDILVSRNSDFFAEFSEKIKQYRFRQQKSELPFSGGAIGYLSYDLGRQLEKLPVSSENDLDYADAVVGFYDSTVVFDHVLKKAWVVGETKQAIDQVMVQHEQHIETITANFSAEVYQATVQKIRDYILAGDVFEVNLTQRFKTVVSDQLDAWQLYCDLTRRNPAPFSAYLNTPDAKLISASPERFLKCVGNQVETRPIKGTIKRSSDLKEDQRLAELLQQSEKDRAENAMIVDLLRNDLSRVCKPHTVKVPMLFGLESYATVHHLVSVVKGELQNNKTVIDLLKAAFPGGSITGAPKIRAMEIIEELEPTRRGPYCGSIFYYDINGHFDSSIVIRTFALKNNTLTFQAGGAVVLDSDPKAEYEESLLKAKALRDVVSKFFIGRCVDRLESVME